MSTCLSCRAGHARFMAIMSIFIIATPFRGLPMCRIFSCHWSSSTLLHCHFRFVVVAKLNNCCVHSSVYMSFSTTVQELSTPPPFLIYQEDFASSGLRRCPCPLSRPPRPLRCPSLGRPCCPPLCHPLCPPQWWIYRRTRRGAWLGWACWSADGQPDGQKNQLCSPVHRL